MQKALDIFTKTLKVVVYSFLGFCVWVGTEAILNLIGVTIDVHMLLLGMIIWRFLDRIDA